MYMKTYETLPDFILSKIVKYLSLTDCANLSLTCLFWRNQILHQYDLQNFDHQSLLEIADFMEKIQLIKGPLTIYTHDAKKITKLIIPSYRC